jgi:hypothetical protein
MNYTRWGFDNLFKLGYFQMEVSEVFDSPDDWTPCDTTEKLVTVKNTGTIEAKARIKMDESWVSKTDEELDLVKDGVKLATIELANDDWALEDGYYYLNNTLAPGESAEFIKSVTFNCETNFVNEEITYTNTETGKEGRSSEHDYLSSTYHLNINIQTIQRDKQLDAWGAVPTPSNP